MTEGKKLVIKEIGQRRPNVTGPGWEPTEEDREYWMKEYGGYSELNVGGHLCFIRQISLGIVQYAMSCVQISDQAYSEALEKNLWLTGDPAIRADTDLLASLHDQLGVAAEPVDVTHSRDGSRYRVNVGEFSCFLKPVVPAFLDAAQRNNRRNKPLATEEGLVKLMWIEGDRAILDDPHHYIGLLLEVKNLREKHLVTVKKFVRPLK